MKVSDIYKNAVTGAVGLGAILAFFVGVLALLGYSIAPTEAGEELKRLEVKNKEISEALRVSEARVVDLLSEDDESYATRRLLALAEFEKSFFRYMRTRSKLRVSVTFHSFLAASLISLDENVPISKQGIISEMAGQLMNPDLFPFSLVASTKEFEEALDRLHASQREVIRTFQPNVGKAVIQLDELIREDQDFMNVLFEPYNSFSEDGSLTIPLEVRVMAEQIEKIKSPTVSRFLKSLITYSKRITDQGDDLSEEWYRRFHLVLDEANPQIYSFNNYKRFKHLLFFGPFPKIGPTLQGPGLLVWAKAGEDLTENSLVGWEYANNLMLTSKLVENSELDFYFINVNSNRTWLPAYLKSFASSNLEIEDQNIRSDEDL